MREMTEFVDLFFEPPFFRILWPPAFTQTTQTPIPVDIWEKDGKLTIKAAVPGVEPNNLDVSIEDHVLTIRGETKRDQERHGAKVYRREYS